METIRPEVSGRKTGSPHSAGNRSKSTGPPPSIVNRDAAAKLRDQIEQKENEIRAEYADKLDPEKLQKAINEAVEPLQRDLKKATANKQLNPEVRTRLLTAAGDRPNATGPPKSTAERDAYSIPEFCARHNISTGTYYNLKKNGQAPREGRVGKRVIITKEAAAEWRQALLGNACITTIEDTAA